MIIIVKKEHEEKQINNLIKWIKGQGLEVDISNGQHSTILGLVGDTSKIDIDLGGGMTNCDFIMRKRV